MPDDRRLIDVVFERLEGLERKLEAATIRVNEAAGRLENNSARLAAVERNLERHEARQWQVIVALIAALLSLVGAWGGKVVSLVTSHP